MAVQPRVLIVREAHPMLRAGGARQESCRRSPVQVVNHVVASISDLTCHAGPHCCIFAWHGDHLIHQIESFEYGRDPVFQQHVDLNTR